MNTWIYALVALAWAVSAAHAEQEASYSYLNNRSETGEIMLSLIYTAEKAYFAENGHYTANESKLGLDLDDYPWTDSEWSFRIHVSRKATRFTAYALSKTSDQAYRINDRKEQKARRPIP